MGIKKSLKGYLTLAAIVASVALGVAIAFSIVDAAVVGATDQCNGQDATILGTDGTDVIYGTSGDDIIVGMGGAVICLASPASPDKSRHRPSRTNPTHSV